MVGLARRGATHLDPALRHASAIARGVVSVRSNFSRSNFSGRFQGGATHECLDKAVQIRRGFLEAMTLGSPIPKNIEALVQSTRVLVVDDDYYMRKVIKSLLQVSGIKTFYEAANGLEGIDAIITLTPDVVLLDWDMPDINGSEFMRIVRSPLTFPLPAVPVVMLTSGVERETVVEAVRLGVNEFLCKPVSAKALYERILAIRAKPRAMVRIGDYYGPVPRKVVQSLDAFTDPTEPVWLT
ncbi:MAG: response regulator [Pseudorhodoplanes sp.]